MESLFYKVASNQVLCLSMKKIGLVCSNVVASLRRALLVDALVENSLLDKPHHFKVGFIKRGKDM